MHPTKSGKVTVAIHKGDLPIGTLNSILKQADLKSAVTHNMERIQLIIEAGAQQASQSGFWGRLTYEDNLIVDQADTVEALQQNMRQLLLDFHDVDNVEFDLAYDLYAFFEHYAYLKISKIADYAGLNPSLLRHYKSQTKFPSAEQVKRIETAVHRLANELRQVHLVAA